MPTTKKAPVKRSALAPVRAKAKAPATARAYKTLTTAAQLPTRSQVRTLAKIIAKDRAEAAKPERERMTDYLAVRMTAAERAHADAKGGSTWVRSLIAKSLAREGKA